MIDETKYLKDMLQIYKIMDNTLDSMSLINKTITDLAIHVQRLEEKYERLNRICKPRSIYVDGEPDTDCFTGL